MTIALLVFCILFSVLQETEGLKYTSMILDDETKDLLSSKLREKLFLQNVQGDFVLFDGETTDVTDVFDIGEEKKNIVKSDIGYLFPYAKDSISFNLVGKMGRNIFLLDSFSVSDPLKPESSLRIENYETKLSALMKMENIDESLLPLYSDAFHAIIEKMTFTDFLNGERGIKEKDYKIYYLLMNTDGDSFEFSSALYIFRSAMKDTAERLCLIDKGDSRAFQGIDLCRK